MSSLHVSLAILNELSLRSTAEVYCSRPIIKGATSIAVISGSESVVTSNQFHYGDRVLLTCQNGIKIQQSILLVVSFTLTNMSNGLNKALKIAGRRGKSNSAILVCQGEGQWVGQPPVCDSQCDTICLNGGSCSISTNGRKCYCPPGYSGDRCQHGKNRKNTKIENIRSVVLHVA